MDSSLFSQQFQTAISNNLPGEQAHELLMPANRRRSSEASKISTDARKSAVGILAYPENSTIKSVLIKRPDYPGTHGNQVSFPGGKMDPEDDNLEYTARRECYEEVNLPLGAGELIGALSSVYIPVSKFIVQPYVFVLNEPPILSPDEREVDSIIHFDLFNLTNEAILKKTDIKFSQGFIQKDVPYFDINGHVVWGATAMMLGEVKSILQKF